MKKLLFVLLSCSLCFMAEGQHLARRSAEDNANSHRNYIIDNYKEYNEMGDSVDGKKHGPWLAMDADSIVYFSGTHDKDMRVGTWRVNYPDGAIRYKVIHDSLGRALEWSRFYYSIKIVSISRCEGIWNDVLSAIMKKENEIFMRELYQYQSSVTKTSSFNSSGYSYNYTEANVPVFCKNFDVLLQKAGEDYLVIEYNYPSGLIAQECIVGQLTIKSRKTYFYKGKKLKRLYYYENEKLIKTETYKNGEVVKVD